MIPSISFATVRFELTVVIPASHPHRKTLWLIGVSSAATAWAIAGNRSMSMRVGMTRIGSRSDGGISYSLCAAKSVRMVEGSVKEGW